MESTISSLTEEATMADNIVFIEFYNKKSFPPGVWHNEPDFVKWMSYGLECVAIRDMKLGCWRGFVGVAKEHPGFSKTFVDMINADWGLSLNVHGGIALTGKLPARYKDLNKNVWWIGFECTQGEDLMPLVTLDKTDPLMAQIAGMQTYKNLKFVRKEANVLAKQLCRIK